jgi:hypothetical protein
MPASSASSSASSGINAPGGSINKGPGVIIFVIIGVLLVVGMIIKAKGGNR